MNIAKWWNKPETEYEGEIIELKHEEIAIEQRSILEKFKDGVERSLAGYRSNAEKMEKDIATMTENLRQVRLCIAGLEAAQGEAK